ncbi:hypothetical protein LUZ61_015019 [Rhynchospora tenuis]|uniref:HAT C-terminal dimerisation domain-containing protein n=1 Tax=Rhynchospora tenuis TaxID=198213 RepID=A0AAD5WBT8_9POAL|nr:hypothetical protein LUZ61_015019 [Rhynchospora tenuis]
MSKSAYPFVVDMSKEMFKKWDKYWTIGSNLLAVACVLDPRCKLHVVEYYFKMMHLEECPRSSSSASSSTISDTRAGLQNFLSDMRSAEPNKTEMEQYLCDALDDTRLDAQFDCLMWWKVKSTKYPIMARLARDILAIPISTVASESTFSTTDRILSPIRSSLNDDSLEALVCAHDWLRASVIETDGVFGDVLWSTDEPLIYDDTITIGGGSDEVV